jgi:S1-C subfamily serine protease
MSVTPDGENDRGFTRPPPLEDRLWRHPSELGLYGTSGPRVVLRKRPSPVRMLVAAASGLILGSAIGVGALAAVGGFGGNDQQTTIERVAAPVSADDMTKNVATAQRSLPAVARLEVTKGSGTEVTSAVVVRNDGLLVTTSDAIDGADAITVVLDDGSTQTAQLMGRDRRNDVGVLSIAGDDLGPLTPALLPATTALAATGFGDRVMLVDAAGPAGGPTITNGVVATPSTPVDTAGGRGNEQLFGMLAVVVAPGSEVPSPGAAVLDSTGAVLGVLTSRAPAIGADSSIPMTTTVYAIPHDHLRRVYEQVATEGRYTPADLAVDVEELPVDTTTGGSGGVKVRTNPADAALRDAGVVQGKVIVAVNGERVTSLNDLRTAIRRYTVGDTVELTVADGGRTSIIPVVISAAPGVP